MIFDGLVMQQVKGGSGMPGPPKERGRYET